MIPEKDCSVAELLLTASNVCLQRISENGYLLTDMATKNLSKTKPPHPSIYLTDEHLERIIAEYQTMKSTPYVHLTYAEMLKWVDSEYDLKRREYLQKVRDEICSFEEQMNAPDASEAERTRCRKRITALIYEHFVYNGEYETEKRLDEEERRCLGSK